MEEQDGRRRWQQEKISILYWSIRIRNSLPPSSSRSFRTPSHWSYTSGQCVNSGNFLRVRLSCWMCNQFTLDHKLRIDTGRTNFETKTVFCTSVDPMNKEHKDPCDIDLEAPRLVWYKQKVEKTSRHGVLGRFSTCSSERIEVLSNKIERNHLSRYTPSVLYPENCYDRIWRNHIRESICVTSASSKDYLQR